MTDSEAVARLATAADLLAAHWERFGPRDESLTPPTWAADIAFAPPLEEWLGRLELRADWKVQYKKTQESLSVMSSKGVVSVPITSRIYPPQLRSIPVPPPILHVAGDVQRLTTGVAVVGSREPSVAGQEAASTVASWLSAMAVPVITGMARGTDQIAARSASFAGGCVIGILPGSPLYWTPLECEAEFRQVSKTGILVGETTAAVSVNKSSFLRRNRIISGIARLVIVPATKATGGTINQLQWARRQGRPSIVYQGGAEQGFATEMATGLSYHLSPKARLVPTANELWAVPQLD